MDRIKDVQGTADASSALAASDVWRFHYDTAPVLMGAVKLLADGDILHLHDNPAANAFFGLPSEATTNKRARADLGVPEDTIQTWLAHYRQAGREQTPVRFDYAHAGTDGKRSWLSVTVSLLSPDQADEPEPCFGYVAQDISDRKAAEQELRTSEERLRLAVTGARLGLWDWDLQTVTAWWGPRTCEIMGVPADTEVTPELRLSLVHPDDVERLTREVTAAIAVKDEFNLEYRVQRADGTVRHIASMGSVIRSASGVPLKTIGVVQDVTEEREAALRLAASEARLRAIYDAVPVGIVVAEAPEGRIVDGNSATERVFGHPVLPSPDIDAYRQWVSFHGDGSLVSPEEYPLSRALRGQDPRPELEVLYRHGSGQDKWVRLVAAPIIDDKATITGAVVAALDVDRSKRLEQELKRLNEILESEVADRTAERDQMWRLSTDLMLVAAFDGRIDAVNPAWTALLGWTPEDLTGSNFLDLVHPDDLPDTLAEMASLESGRTTFRFTNRYRAAVGEYRFVSWTAVPGSNRIYAVGRDISAEVRAARDLELAQEALRQSQKLDAMGQLTGGVAHDFNNLLTPIIGGLDLLQRRNFGDERARRILGGALDSAERAKTLVQRLLAFARRQPLQPIAVDVSKVVNDMANLLASTLGPRVELRIDAPQNLPAARADPNQLEMALLNLTVNARDAMPSGGSLKIEVRLMTMNEDQGDLPPGDYLGISVQDTGEGMDAQTLARCVEPFFSTKGVGRGTGLGLSMVHGLAAQLAGALRIRSTPGRGTTVALLLPATASEIEPLGPNLTFDVPRASGMALVVDDEELVRQSTAEMLSDLGYETLQAASAEEALQILRERDFNVLVTDHLMPGMTGTQLARTARSDFPSLKVVIVSGYADAEGIDSSYTRLTKPFRQADLVAALDD